MNHVLLDTSILIDFLRQKDKKENTLFVQLLQQEYQLSISMVTHTELFSGKRVWESEKLRDEITLLFSGIQILPIDEKVSKKAGEIRAKHNIHIIDAIIAATALTQAIELVTLNTKDFEAVSGLKLFHVKLTGTH